MFYGLLGVHFSGKYVSLHTGLLCNTLVLNLDDGIKYFLSIPAICDSYL